MTPEELAHHLRELLILKDLDVMVKRVSTKPLNRSSLEVAVGAVQPLPRVFQLMPATVLPLLVHFRTVDALVTGRLWPAKLAVVLLVPLVDFASGNSRLANHQHLPLMHVDWLFGLWLQIFDERLQLLYLQVDRLLHARHKLDVELAWHV